jgi:AcrR family transcriptional regulator
MFALRGYLQLCKYDLLTTLSIAIAPGDTVAMKARRQRRSVEEAKREILDAAERRMAETGPAGIRLQDVAADVGVSHPAILHHFGSREGLVQAVVDRALRVLEADLLAALSLPAGSVPDPAALLDRVFETLGNRGQARVLAWLILSGHEPFSGAAARAGWARIAEVTHAARLAVTRGKKPPYEDTQFTILLAALVVFGEAIAGGPTFKVAGVEGRDGPRRFRAWFASLLLRHLADGERG